VCGQVGRPEREVKGAARVIGPERQVKGVAANGSHSVHPLMSLGYNVIPSCRVVPCRVVSCVVGRVV